ncbi:MAG: tetratricopeptide repeat protein [Acidobacteria bacterium]|nr:tetratricopeptide repeat protein [Acidobacteriota bacterium]
MASRLEQLAGIVAQSPGNVLARYGLAMEYATQGAHAEAIENFRTLMAASPNYVAAYYQAGRVLQKMNETAQARTVLEQGIEASIRAGDSHARGEIEALLAELN